MYGLSPCVGAGQGPQAFIGFYVNTARLLDVTSVLRHAVNLIKDLNISFTPTSITVATASALDH